MLTSKEFAKMLNVSQSTVSRALSGSNQVSEETRRYISQKAEEVGFVLNSQAQSLKMKKSGTVGILFPSYFESLSKNMMFTYIYDCILKHLLQFNYDVMIIYDENPGSKLTVLERAIKSCKVDGFISLHSTLTENEVSMISKYRFPCVHIFQTLDSLYTINQFGCDEYTIGKLAGTNYAYLEGHRIEYIGTQINRFSSDERLRGFKDGLAAQGKTIDKVAINADFSMTEAYQTIQDQQEWLEKGKTALFVYNDMMALGVVRAAIDMGLNVPGDIKVIGVDDVPISDWLPPRLSTIHIPVEEMVYDSCEKLCELLNNQHAVEPKTVYYQPSLIHRDTTLVSNL